MPVTLSRDYQSCDNWASVNGMPSHRRINQVPPVPHFPGVALSRTSLGGVEVEVAGRSLGWMHENNGRWNAYQKVPGESLGKPLGRFATPEEAVRRIVQAPPPTP